MSPDISNTLQKISERLKTEYHAAKVILFGSYARGDATRDSDIDLFIIAPTKERFFDRMATVRGFIRDLRKGLPVAPIVLTPQEVEQRKRKRDQFVQEILKNGVAL